MKKLLGVLFLLLMAMGVQAAPPAQPTGPAITAFSTPVTVVDRANLQRRAVRIPVSWDTANRPLTANLYFEQVLPDDSWINVELPRLIPWVASSGDGIAAPIEAFPGATEVTLRLRMVDLFTQQLYDERNLTIPIGSTGEPAATFGNVPTINRFSIQSPTILRNNLGTPNGLIGVAWQSTNRPFSATFVFEQVMPGGQIVNVELPRDNPWVNSSGNGQVIPRDPGSNIDQIRLRIRLVDMINGRIYDQRMATVNILNQVPTAIIDYFTTSATSVTLQSLNQGTARIPVSWSVRNRPNNSNLVFEQILSDGRIINVELPRPNPIVPSSGTGVVAPRNPGGNATIIRLRLRLINLSGGADFASALVELPIIGQAPPPGNYIDRFDSPTPNVGMGELKANNARVTVNWSLRSRPFSSNLVFEQILSNGQRVNVELPRQNPIVPSSGSGVVAPVWPGSDTATTIRLTLRLIDLGTQRTLDQREIQLPIVGNQGGGVQYGDVCFGSPYAPRIPISVGIEGTVIRADSPNGLRMYNLPNGDVAEILSVGENFSVIGGPACWTIQTFAPGQSDFRMWRIRTHAHNAEAWVHEYEYIVDGGRFAYNLRELQTGPGDQDPVINAYSVDPSTAAPGAAVNVAWDVRNASSVNLEVFAANGQSIQRYDSLNVSHSMNYTVPQSATGTLRLVLTVIDTQGRTSISQERNLTVTPSCQFSSSLDPNRCPVSQVSTSIVTQSFERGTMLWREDTRKIYVFFSDGSFQIYDDTWDPSQPPNSGETPPDGLILPGQGFGKVWNNQPGVRDRMGWATAGESAMTSTIETYNGVAGTDTYMTVPNGRVLVLSGGAWRAQ